MWNSKITTFLLGALCLWLVLMVAGAQIHLTSVRRDAAAIYDRITIGALENERLADEVERMKNPSWLALLARARLNYKQPDETVVFVYKSEKSGMISPSQAISDKRPNWKKWLDWLRGA